ncbi:MAG: hypothetical protein INR73_22040 [Williamsia sp.]|nr:hypothetical protein [Williamsia sp.]
MTKIITLFSLFLLVAVFVQAQPAKDVFVEIGGPGLASFNYDMRFTNREDGIGGRVGVGGFKIDDVTAVFIPVGVNYLIGKNHRDYFEMGGGATFVSIKDRYGYNNDDVFRSSFGHLVFGYRLQPANGGFLFRASIVPIFGNGFFVPYYAGVAFGYKF